jgi:hypothetical protein
MEQTFTENGAFNINDQWATGIRYDALLENDRIARVSARVLNGRTLVAELKDLDREQALALLGEKNVANIEAGLGSRDPGGHSRQGRLQGQHLAFHKSYTPERLPENTLTLDTEHQDRHYEARVRDWIQNRRQQLAELHQALSQGAEPSVSVTRPAPPKPAAVEREDAIPASVSRRFLQVDRQFYFPDRSPAFEDQGRKLVTKTDYQEVVRALVAIAQARHWTHITVTGTETFRRAAWLEAAQRGIEVRGFEPSEMDKAQRRRSVRQPDSQERSVVPGPTAAAAAREKAQAFRIQDRATVVQAHPDLAPAYGTLAVARRWAEKEFKTQADQDRFVAVTKEMLAQRIETHQAIPAPQVRWREQARPDPTPAPDRQDRRERQVRERERS